jgi:hypothetical protein
LRQNQVEEDGSFPVERKRFSVEQITGILKHVNPRTSVQEPLRSARGVSSGTATAGRIYGEMDPEEVRELKQSREGNLKLKRLAAALCA